MAVSKAIDERCDFMKLDEAAASRLRGAKTVVMQELPAALEEFYKQVRATPAMARFSRAKRI